jgi:hypothetical protein
MAEEATGAPATAAATGEPAAAAPVDGSALLHPSASDAPAAAPAEAPAEAPKEAEAKDEDKSADKPAGAPEEYKDFAMPEGVELDAEALEKFTPVAKELNLDQDQAQKLVDFYAAERTKLEQGVFDNWQKTQTEWQETVKSDEEVGGAEMEEKLGIANKALEKFGGEKLSEALLATGAGNHVEVVRFAYRVGKAMSEDTIGTNSAAPKNELDRAKLLFPNQN